MIIAFTNHNQVVEWDVSSHKEGYDIWLSAVLADGGGDCKRLCELHNEPLIDGMLVGQPEHELSVLGRRSVRNLIQSLCVYDCLHHVTIARREKNNLSGKISPPMD